MAAFLCTLSRFAEYNHLLLCSIYSFMDLILSLYISSFSALLCNFNLSFQLHFVVCKGELFTPGARKAFGTVFSLNKHVQDVLKTLLASGFHKCFIILTNRLQGKHATMAQDLNTSTLSADSSLKAIRKIFRKYNQVLNFMI